MGKRRRVVTTRGQVLPKVTPLGSSQLRGEPSTSDSRTVCPPGPAGRLLRRETEWNSGAGEPSGPGVTCKGPPRAPLGLEWSQMQIYALG